jgi:Zn-finger nucleic acid-binding protein
LARIFKGAKHCSACGTVVNRSKDVPTPGRLCPRCRVALHDVTVGDAALRECQTCGGVWLDAAVFEAIRSDKERQAAVLGRVSKVRGTPKKDDRLRYVPCPDCSRLMNRFNFARISGVIVDACKGHGTWLDRDELQRIVEFIRDGGLDEARRREKEDVEEERRRLREEELRLARLQRGAGAVVPGFESDRVTSLLRLGAQRGDDLSGLMAVAKALEGLFRR